jgi:hypothetical protein
MLSPTLRRCSPSRTQPPTSEPTELYVPAIVSGPKTFAIGLPTVAPASAFPCLATCSTSTYEFEGSLFASRTFQTEFDAAWRLSQLTVVVIVVSMSLALIGAVKHNEPPLTAVHMVRKRSLPLRLSHRIAALAVLLLLLAACVSSQTAITDANIKTAAASWIATPTTATTTYGNIADWNTAAVTFMNEVFYNRPTFNDDVGKWNVASVTSMQSMFTCAIAFNKMVGAWNTASVTNMQAMFSFGWGVIGSSPGLQPGSSGPPSTSLILSLPSLAPFLRNFPPSHRSLSLPLPPCSQAASCTA